MIGLFRDMYYILDIKVLLELFIIDLPDQTAQSNFSHHRGYLARTVLRQISFWYVLPSENRMKITLFKL